MNKTTAVFSTKQILLNRKCCLFGINIDGIIDNTKCLLKVKLETMKEAVPVKSKTNKNNRYEYLF